MEYIYVHKPNHADPCLKLPATLQASKIRLSKSLSMQNELNSFENSAIRNFKNVSLPVQILIKIIIKYQCRKNISQNDVKAVIKK